MIRLLQKTKAKRGFTMIELIIVIAVIAILAAMILPSLDTKKAKIEEACSASRDLYNAAQSLFTKYSLYEAPLSLQLKALGVEAENDSTKDYTEYVRFYKKAGGNFPCTPGTITVSDMPATADLYIELVTKDGIIQTVYMANTFAALLQHGEDTTDTVFGTLFRNDLETRVDVREGYYYLQVSYKKPPAVGLVEADYVNPVMVKLASYSMNPLPAFDGSDWAAYETEHLFFSQHCITKDGLIRGVFAPGTKGDKGTYLSKDDVAPPAP